MSKQAIKIDKETVHEIVKDLNESVSEIEDYIKDLKINLDGISTAWKGVDATKYIDSLSNDYVNDLYKLNKSLVSFADYLDNVPLKYDELDDNYKEKISNIEV